MWEGLAANRCLDVIEVESRAALIGHERPLSQPLLGVYVCVVLFPSHVPLVCQPMWDYEKCGQQTLSNAWPIHYFMHV